MNIINFFLAALSFADKGLTSGSTAQSKAQPPVGTMESLPYGERARTIFSKIADCTPGEFRNAVEIGEAKQLRDLAGNTVMHRAIETGNLALVDLLRTEYGFIGNAPNFQGQTCIMLAHNAGGEFAGVFGDVIPQEVAV